MKKKAGLIIATIHTETAKGQSGSVLQMALSGDSGPMRFAENDIFKKTSLNELLQYSQVVGSVSLPDGHVVKYIKEVIYNKLQNNELADERAITLEISKMFKEMYKKFEDMHAKLKEENVLKPADKAVENLSQWYEAEAARFEQLNAPIRAEVKRQEQLEIETNKQMILTINNFKTAIADIQKMNKTVFTPTGIKAMQAEIKKFDALPNPTNRDREKLIDNIKKIANARLQEMKSSRGKILEEFYRKISHAEVGKANTLSKEQMSKSQIAIKALITIQILTAKNNGRESTFGKIHDIVADNIPATDKMAKIKAILQARLANGDNLKPEYKQTYKALVRFILEVEKGKTPNLDDPKMLFLNKKLADIRNDQIVQNLRSSGLLATPEVEKVTTHHHAKPKHK